MAKYKLTTGPDIIRTSDGAGIPANPDNADYQEYLQWRAAGGVPDPAQTLDEAKAAKRAKINANRNRIEQGGFEYMGKVFDSDSVSGQRINFAAFMAREALLAGESYALSWTCQDNSKLPLDAAGVIGMAKALAIHGKTQHDHADELKTRLDAAATVEAVDEIPEW